MFGLNGQGLATQPADGIAIASRAITSTDTHGMMVSIFPYDLNSAYMVSGKKIDMSVKTVAWRVITSITAPTQPAAAVAPDAALASYLFAGTIAFTASVAASLY